MTDINIKEKCKHCLGTGILDGVSCEKCGGDGWVESNKIDITDIMDDLDRCKKRLKKIMDAMGLND